MGRTSPSSTGRYVTPRPRRAETPGVARTPSARVPANRSGPVEAVKARPYSGSTRGARSARGLSRNGARGGNRGSYPSISLGFDHGELRYGSIRLNDSDHHGGHANRHGHHIDRHHSSTYGQLYYDHRARFYGPYRSYWSTAYYPDYTPIYGLGYTYSTPRYGYSFGSVYYGGPREVTICDETPYVATQIIESVPVATTVETIEETRYASNQNARAQASGAASTTLPVPAPAAVDTAIAESQGWGPILGEGNLSFSQGRYDDARRVYVRAMLIDERDGYAKMLYAWANFALGDYQLAATALRRALLTSPDLVKYPIDIRLHYGDLVSLDHQVDALQTYVATNPTDREAGLLLGYLFYSIGDLPRGLAAFDDLASSDPDDQSVKALREAAASAAKAQVQGQ